jgi:hypothetical protein
MNTNFHVTLEKSNGNLNLRLTGNFDGSSAWKLINLLHEHYSGKGKIFVDTHDLRDILPFGCSVFKYHLNQRRLPADRLVFKGKKGLEIAPEGSHVLLEPEKHKCRYNGDCANCSCCREDKGEGGQPTTIQRLQS